MSSEGGSRSTHSQNERMYSLIDSVPSIAQQYVVTADRVVVDAVPLVGGFGDDVLYPGVLKTTSMPDCAVLFRRYFGTHAAAITRHEVALLLRVAHKNVLGVVGLVDVSPHESYVLLEGNSSSSNLQTLATGLRARLGTVAFCRQAVQWTLDVAAGLAHMHSNNIFHFNIHASSIIVCGGTAKINASGVAQRLALLDIASPEALQLAPSSDVFGIGCVLCELLTGSAPWGKSTGIALLRPHGGPDVMGLPWADSSIPIVKTLVKQLLHADSRHRGTLVEIIPELQNLLDTVIKVAEPPQPTLSMGLCSLAPGWLDAVDPQPSLLDALLCLIGCPLPVDRTDLAAHHADLNSPKLAAWYHYAADTITKSIPHFTVGSQQWEDACAIMLYTCESPICYMINGMLSQRGRVQSALKHITPMARRLFDAVRRLGTPYTSEAFRVVYADNKLLQQPHSDYKTHFAVGRPVNFYQFASFTTDMERIQSFTDQQRPMFVFKCSNICGFHINEYSDQRLQGHMEAEVLVLPPSYFVVKSKPYPLKGAVIVEVECLVDETNSGTYANNAAHQPLSQPQKPSETVEQLIWCDTCDKFTEFLPVIPAHKPHSSEHFCPSCIASRIEEIATVSALHGSGVTSQPNTYVHYDHLANMHGIPPPPSVIVDTATLQQMSPTLRDAIQQVWLLHTSHSAQSIHAATLPPQLRTLVSSHFDDQILTYLSNLTRLRNLNLASSKHLTEQGLLQLGLSSQLQHLQSLSLSHCLVTDAVLKVISSSTQLRQLYLAACVEITDAGLANIAHLTQLQELSLTSCANITDVGLAHVANMMQLRKLYFFENVNITDAGIARIAHLTQMRDLSICACAKFTDAGLVHVANMKLLQKLYLWECVEITDAGIVKIAHLTQLQELSISSCVKITDVGLAHIVNMTQLGKLYLRGCVEVTDAGLAKITHLTQLKELSITSCAKITDVGLAHIANMTQLQKLYLGGCVEITNVGLAKIAHLTQMQVLFFVSCAKITDAGLAHVANMTQMQELYLNECVEITDAGVAKIAHLAQMQVLALNSCAKITDAALACIANMTQLQRLDLQSCVKITDAGLEKIAHLPHLKTLDLNGCNQITSAPRQALGRR